MAQPAVTEAAPLTMPGDVPVAMPSDAAVTQIAAAMEQEPLGPRLDRAAHEPPVLDEAHFTITVHSPFRSVAKARQLMNEIAIDLMAQLGYNEAIGTDDESRAARMTGISEHRFFLKKTGPRGERRTIELDLIRAASGTFDILVYGISKFGNEDRPNPDLTRFLPTVITLFNEAESGSQGEDHGPLGHFLFQLSYIQADQAVGMLKALGYSTVEFSKQPGATIWENLYEPVQRGEARFPYVVKFIEGSKMSLMEPIEPTPGAMPQMPVPGYGGTQRQTIPDIGGTFLHHMTTGEPEQRLLIIYDQEQPEDMEKLLNMLRETIDVPARQVVISALIVELNSDRAKDLGFTFTGGNGASNFNFNRGANGEQQPFTFTFDSSKTTESLNFSATLAALIDRGEAEILSNPSVLVLDGRQARIQIGQQIPVVNSTSTTAATISSVEYFPVGIVLNLRPRINERASEVTMQVETIVSAVGQNVATSDVFYAPTIDNRQVQTFVRVANDTPFIIGGLIASKSSEDRQSVPLLGSIPGLGTLFRRTTSANTKKEVIVVLTPHIIPPDRPSFSYVIPKDSSLLDSSGLKLFRNAYRIRSEDVHDLHFIDDSDVFQALLARIRARADSDPAIRSTEPYASLLEGLIPGEEILVRRMLWEIINRTGIAHDLDFSRVTIFEGSTDDTGTPHLQISRLSDNLGGMSSPNSNAVVLSFDAPRATIEHPFAQPHASIESRMVAPGTSERVLLEMNTTKIDGTPERSSIVLGPDDFDGVKPLDVLKGVLVLKKLLALNTGVPLTLANFHVGRQVIFPTEQDVAQGNHVIDRETARLFFEVVAYYPAFEREFNRQTRAAMRAMALDISR